MQVNTGQTEGFTQTIQVLQTEYDGIKAQLDTLQTITAATNGYFSSVSASPTIVTDAAQLDAATPAELNELLQNGFPAADTTNCAGRSPQASAGSSTLSATWPRRIGWTAFPV